MQEFLLSAEALQVLGNSNVPAYRAAVPQQQADRAESGQLRLSRSRPVPLDDFLSSLKSSSTTQNLDCQTGPSSYVPGAAPPSLKPRRYKLTLLSLESLMPAQAFPDESSSSGSEEQHEVPQAILPDDMPVAREAPINVPRRRSSVTVELLCCEPLEGVQPATQDTQVTRYVRARSNSWSHQMEA